MRQIKRKEVLLAAGLATGLASCSVATAGSFALREQSTIGLGDAYAGAAAGAAGLGSLYWNPATMTDFAGWQSNVNAAGIFPYATIKPVAGTSPLLLGLGGSGSTGNIMPDAVLPSSYTSYEVNDRLWLGLATNTPFGLASRDPTNFAGQIYARSSQVVSFDVNPTLAYKVNDWLSLGFGAEALYFKTRLSQATSPLPNAPSATLQGDDVGFGLTSGLTVRPWTGTEFGVGYRSSIGESLSGHLWPVPALSVPSKANLTLPDEVTLGLRQAVTPVLDVNAGYEWTRWSSLGTVNVVNPFTTLGLPFRYRDGSYASLGAAYRLLQNLTLRAGFGYEWSPISTSNRDLRLPDSDRISLNVGFGYRFNDRLSLDFAYAHVFGVGKTAIDIGPGNGNYIAGLPLIAAMTSDADVASLGVTYRW
jgi:long-chain fatty acid transport protein